MQENNVEITGDLFKRIQTIDLEMLMEIDRVCRKNNIKYSIMYGTLLGAVRHGGFIPWDDDCDVVFRRYEYEKFFEACKRTWIQINSFCKITERIHGIFWVWKTQKKWHSL